MKDFKFHSPTKIVFGRDSEKLAGKLVKEFGGNRVLVHFGGESAKKSGLLDSVCNSLKDAGLKFELLGGVKPNPRVSKVREAIKICREHDIDFILAVGGGSVIDSAKAAAIGADYDGDVWDFYEGKATPKKIIPLGAVLTIAAAGSEMSDGTVISNEDGGLKRAFCAENLHCSFSLLNPELTCTLPAYQTACGCVDMIMHNLERYFSPTPNLEVTDEISESVMRTVVKNSEILKHSPQNYDARAEIMWCGTLSHNDVTGSRYNGDWASHQLEHELSGMFDIAHGAGLSAIWSSWARYVCSVNPSRFARLGEKVFGLGKNPNAKKGADNTILRFEEYFRSLDLPANMIEAKIDASPEKLEEMADKCSFGNTRKIGSFMKLGRSDILKIYQNASKKD